MSEKVVITADRDVFLKAEGLPIVGRSQNTFLGQGDSLTIQFDTDTHRVTNERHFVLTVSHSRVVTESGSGTEYLELRVPILNGVAIEEFEELFSGIQQSGSMTVLLTKLKLQKVEPELSVIEGALARTW